MCSVRQHEPCEGHTLLSTVLREFDDSKLTERRLSNTTSALSSQVVP